MRLDPSVPEFIAQLEQVPWFRNLGHPLPADADVERIFAWDDWPGPEEPAILELHTQQQDFHDEIMAEAGENRPALSELWDRIHAAVFRRAPSAIPFDSNRDAWYGPTTAVWHAAWTRSCASSGNGSFAATGPAATLRVTSTGCLFSKANVFGPIDCPAIGLITLFTRMFIRRKVSA